MTETNVAQPATVEDRAKRRVQARSGFVVHAIIYLFANAGLVAIWLLTGRGYPWFAWPLVIWGIGVVAHAVSLFVGPDTPFEANAIQRELRRMRGQA